jgi:hypothetical protein
LASAVAAQEALHNSMLAAALQTVNCKLTDAALLAPAWTLDLCL